MEKVKLRAVKLGDVEGISAVLQEIVAAGKRTRPSDLSFVESNYVTNPNQIRCTLALRGSLVLGFQSLIRAVADNRYDVVVGWGVIGTHIRPSAARLGIGRALFQESLEAARAAELPAIDATIGSKNVEGLAYYTAMGFVDYKRSGEAVSKKFTVY